jgi:hypothetical protein
MKKKKAAKSKTARMRDLPAKTLNAKAAKGVKGGSGGSIGFAKVNVEYHPQH